MVVNCCYYATDCQQGVNIKTQIVSVFGEEQGACIKLMRSIFKRIPVFRQCCEIIKLHRYRDFVI